jgi:hypothetical protein
MVTVTLLLVVVAFLLAVAAAAGRAPLWVSVVLLSIVLLLQSLPR